MNRIAFGALTVATVFAAQTPPRAPTPAITTSPSPAAESISTAIRRNTYPITISADGLSGPGFEFLMSAAAEAQFVALGEEHVVLEIPKITTLLFRALSSRYGFQHLALETDPVMARAVSVSPLRGNREAVFAFARRYPNAFTFDTDQEIEMIAESGSISRSRANPVWGLDQVFGALHVYERLAELAPDAETRRRVLRLAEEARPYETLRFQPDRRYMLDSPKAPTSCACPRSCARRGARKLPS